MHTASGFGIGFATFGKGATMNRIVLAIAFCISATLGVACDTEPTPAGASADSGASNTNTDTATSTATGTGGSVSPNGGSVATGTGGAIGTGGTSAPASTATNTGTGTNITIVVNIVGAGGAAATGGTSATATGGDVASTGGATGTGGTSAATTTAPAKLCIPGQAVACIAATGNGRQICSNDGMSYSSCTALASGTGGTTGTGGATATGGAVAGNGICDAAHVGTKFNGQVCEKNTIDIYVWVPLGTGGSTGTGGKTSATGGSVSTGGTSATGGSTGTGGFNINTSVACDATMSDGTKVSYSFVQNWVGRPVDNGKTTSRFCLNPAWLMTTSDGVSRACPATTVLRVYDEQTLGPSASYAHNNDTLALTADGYCFTTSDMPNGNYHFSYSYPNIVGAWAYYPRCASSPDLPLSSGQWIEHGPNGYGLVMVANGFTMYPLMSN
jgi:hypothetical protein